MFVWSNIESRSADGRLQAVGLAWTENKEWFDTLVLFIGFMGLIFGTVVTFVSFGVYGVSKSPGALVGIGVGLGLVSLLYWAYKLDIVGTPRQLIFTRDGRMLAPLGMSAYRKKDLSIGGDHAEIVSIEAKHVAVEGSKTAHTHGVVLYFRSGAIVYPAQGLAPDEAHLCAVQLKRGLDRLRDELGHEALLRGARPAGAGAARSWAAGHDFRPVH